MWRTGGLTHPLPHLPHRWKGYYAHYARRLSADDLLIKCDDDVVFISNLQRPGAAHSALGPHRVH